MAYKRDEKGAGAAGEGDSSRPRAARPAGRKSESGAWRRALVGAGVRRRDISGLAGFRHAIRCVGRRHVVGLSALRRPVAFARSAAGFVAFTGAVVAVVRLVPVVVVGLVVVGERVVCARL